MKVGILGLGSIGMRHADNLRKLGHTVIGWDPDMRARLALNGVLHAPGDVLRAADALVIASPSHCHVRDLMDAGAKPVLVEKPIGVDASDLQYLQLPSTSVANVMVGNNLRFHPCIVAAKKWIDEGRIGKPLWAQFTSGALSVKPAYLSDGVLLITGAHEVDLALYLLGPAKVLCASVHCTEHGDDIADFVLQHESGARSTHHLDFVTQDEIRECWIVGDEKRIGVDMLGRRASLGKFVQEFDGDYSGDYLAEMSAFIDRCEGKEAPGASGADGLATLEILLDVRRKARAS